MDFNGSRREFLKASGIALSASVAGCIGRLGSGGSNRGPSLRLRSLDVEGSPGGKIAIQPSDRVVLLDFFATWCAPCKPEMKNLRAVREKFSEEKLFMVSITWERDEEAIKDFWRRYNGTWPVVIDPETTTAQKYGVNNLPTIIIMTPDGEEVWRHVGLAGEEALTSNVEKALEKTSVV